MVDVHFVEMIEHGLLELFARHAMRAGETAFEIFQRVAAKAGGNVAMQRGTLEKQLSPHRLRFVAGDDAVVMTIEQVEEAVGTGQGLGPGHVGLGGRLLSEPRRADGCTGQRQQNERNLS